MTDKLNEQVSALLDNELSDKEASSVLAKISQDQELRQKWERYHMIGDVMRGEVVSIDAGEISERVKEQIDLEPAIISIPKKEKNRSWKSNWVKPAAGAALAASVATVVVLNAPGFLGTTDTAQPLTASTINTPPPKQFVNVANVNKIPPTPAFSQNVTGTRWKNLKEPSLESRLNSYLVNHSEYAAPGSGIRVMPYATFVGYDSNNKLKPKPKQ
jgi:sigma-E factor negative regulatory protein RseA